jgi:UTP--glucose-1-phosphate uridylyltransferase
MILRKAVVPAAGWGTRLLPATKIVQKELLPIVDKPTVEYAVQEIAASGFNEVIFITTDQEGNIKNYFLHNEELYKYLKEKGKDSLLKTLPKYHETLNFKSVQQPEASGLGAAILLSESAIGNEAFAVTLVDDVIDAEIPVLEQLKSAFNQTDSSIISVMEVSEEEVSMYGIVEADEVAPNLYKIKRLIEKPDPSETSSRLAIIGRYILTPHIFEALKKTPKGKGGEIQLTDALSLVLQKEEIYAYKFKGTRIDAGDKLGLLKANIYFGAKREKWFQELKDFIAGLPF